MTSSSPPSSSTPPDDLEWEEWDSSTSPLSFAHHCLAGSFAGVAEHTLLYPLDTVKTCWQSQVLHKASGGGMGCGEPCGVSETVNKLRGGNLGNGGSSMGAAVSGNGVYNPLSQAVAEARTTAAMPSAKSTSSNLKLNHHATSQSQGIWSTMKHLMQQGHHHHSHPINHQFSHAHVYTLAGNPPNVVDLTVANTNTATAESSSVINNITKTTAADSTNKSKRPWSKQSRVLRNATIQDITAHGMIRTAGTTNNITAHPNTINNNNAGFKRLWRGVQTMFVGCIPAHALYFSSYEAIKSFCTTDQYRQGHPQQHTNHVGHDTLSPTQAMLAGGVATLLHDFIMTPMDTMKQRMQLGHYDNLRHAFVSIVWGDHHSNNKVKSSTEAMKTAGGEGWKGLYRSFPITVMTNVPYGMIMMTTNEWLRGVLEDALYGIHNPHEHEENPFHFATILLSGMGAGTIASAATAPLDRVKTRLQTQRMGMVLPGSTSSAGAAMAAAEASATGGGGPGSAIMEERALAAARGEPKVCPKMAVRDVKRTLFPSTTTLSTTSNIIQQQHQQLAASTKTPFKTYYTTPLEAFRSILQEEGPRGLFRGTLPRVALHAPSVAISWTAYEMAKDWLVWLQ